MQGGQRLQRVRTAALTLIQVCLCLATAVSATPPAGGQAAAPTDHEPLLARARNAIEIGHLRPARALLEALNRQNPRDLDAALLLAEIYHRQGHQRPALAILNRAAAANTADARLQVAAARILSSDGQFPAARQAVASLRSIDPTHDWIRPLQGLLALAGNQPALAVAATDAAVTDPAAERFRLGAKGAAVLLHVGTSLEAFLATPGVKDHRMDRFTERYLRHLDVLPRIREIVANFPETLGSDLWVLRLRLGLAQVSGNEVEKRSILEHLTEREPEQGDWVVALAELDFAQQRFASSVARLRIGFSERPMPYPVALLAGRAVERTGDCKLGVPLLEQYLATDPTNPEGNIALARCYVAEGRAEDAEQRLRQALGSSPEFAPAVTALARLLLESGRSDEAATLTQEYQETKRRSQLRQQALTSLRQAERALDAARWVEALRHARAALGLDERLVTAQAIVAMASLELGDAAAARVALERVIALEPGNVGARLELARLLELAGEVPGAITMLEQTITVPAADPAAVERARSELARLRGERRDE